MCSMAHIYRLQLTLLTATMYVNILVLWTAVTVVADTQNNVSYNHHNTRPTCEIKCIKSLSAPTFFINHDGPVPSVIQHCKVNKMNSSECVLDMKDDIMTLHNTTEAAVFYIRFLCSNKDTRILFQNKHDVNTPHLIGYLWMTDCKVYWDDIIGFSNSMDLKVLYLEDILMDPWEDESNSSVDNITMVPGGLHAVGTLGVYLNSDDSIFPPILTSFIWPNMAEIEIHTNHNSLVTGQIDVDKLKMTMPKLQGIELHGHRLSKLPSVFPWDPRDFKLPLNLSRSAVGNQHYANAHGIVLHASIYRRVLFLDNINITDLSSFVFKGRLMKIRMKNNHLKQIGSNTFSKIKGLQSLDISNNLLINLPDGAFDKLQNLSVLTLANNKLQSLPTSIFQRLLSLKNIDISGNQIKWIQNDVFINMPLLETVNLDNNNIHKIEDNAFTDQENIKKIILSNNNMTMIPDFIFLLRNLDSADISNNNIRFESMVEGLKTIDPRHLLFQNRITASSYTPKLEEPERRKYINLKNNKIKTIDLSKLNDHTWLVLAHIFVYFNLDINDNGFICDCRTYKYYQFLHGEENIPDSPVKEVNLPKNRYYRENLNCFEPKFVRGVKLYNMLKEDFSCTEDIDRCPDECQCSLRTMDNAVLVNCANRNLTHLPNNIPKGAKTLNFSSNALCSVQQFPKYMKQLERLSLDNNEIESLSVNFVDALCHSTISELLLSHNKLRYIPKEIQQLQRNTILKLGYNKWKCDCNTEWMKDFLIVHRTAVPDLDNIFCVTSSSESNVLIETPADEFVCPTPPEVIYTIVGIILLGIIILICIMYRYRGEIKILLYVHFNWHPFDTTEETDILSTNYDAFISYSGLDYKWVCFDLLKKLENHDPPYRTCLHDRDFMPGAYIEDSIMEAVQTSRRMILVLSNNYLQSDWCMLEFRAAHNKVLNERTNYLILVLYDDVNIDDLDEDLKLYIRTNTYLSVSNKWFYDKIFYAMPQKTVRQLKKELADKKKQVKAEDTHLVTFSQSSCDTSITDIPDSEEK